MENTDIIIVCYNCGKDIASLLGEIRSGDYPLGKLRVIVVDNASQDDSLEILKRIEGIDLKIIESPKNLGFGAGCNLAIEYLSAPKTLLLNPDVVVYPNSIINLLKFSNAHPEALIWGGRTFNDQGLDDGKGAWREPSLVGVLSWVFFGDVLLKKLRKPIPDAYRFPDNVDLIEVDAISGCFFMIDTSTFKRLGGFDERFFMYSEEIDLCRRAREVGAKPLSTRQACIVHHGSQTLNSLNKLNFLYYNKLKYCQKYWPTTKFKLARLAIRAGTELRIAAFRIAALLNPTKHTHVKLWSDFRSIQKDWRF